MLIVHKENNYRGVSILKSNKIDGTYERITNGFITPKNSNNMDGTLYLSIHSPNNPSDSARALLLPIKDNGNKLSLNIK